MFKIFYSYLRSYKFKNKLFKVFMKYFLSQFVLFAVAVCIGTSYMMKKNNEEMMNIGNSQLRRIEDMADMIYTQANRTGASLCVDMEVSAYIHADNGLLNEGLEKRIAEKMIYYKRNSNYIDSICIYSPEFERICATNAVCRNKEECENYEDYDFVKHIQRNLNGDTLVAPRKVRDRYPRVISFVKKTIGGGYVIVNISYEKFTEAMSPVYDREVVLCVLDNSRSIIFPDNLSQNEKENIKALIQNKNGTIINKKDKSIYYETSIGYYKQNFAVKMNVADFVDKKADIIKIAVVFMICFTFISMYVACFLTLSSMQVVIRLYDVLENKNFDLSNVNKSEEKYIIKEIIHLMDENREFKLMLDERLKEYNNAQVTALQKQINPHFLNNVLSMISYKILSEEDAKTQALKMIVILTRIIRYGFNTDTIMVSLKQEIDFIYDYIKITREQYGDFEFCVDVPEALYDKNVLRLSIQPFVENAVYHGIQDIKSEGKITLSAKLEEKKLVIEIEDNGIGISEEKIKELNNMQDTSWKESHIGIYNTYRRMKLIYSDECSLTFKSDGKSYTRVVMSIPI